MFLKADCKKNVPTANVTLNFWGRSVQSFLEAYLRFEIRPVRYSISQNLLKASDACGLLHIREGPRSGSFAWPRTSCTPHRAANQMENFAAQRIGAIVLQARRAEHLQSKDLDIEIWQL